MGFFIEGGMAIGQIGVAVSGHTSGTGFPKNGAAETTSLVYLHKNHHLFFSVSNKHRRLAFSTKFFKLM
jgi:hypothetical protein